MSRPWRIRFSGANLIYSSTAHGGQYWAVDRVARINVDRIETEGGTGSLADAIRSTTAHELGHSCWLEHHGDDSQNQWAGMKGPVCIMRTYSDESQFCPYATPCPGGVNAETGDPAVFGLDSWDCEPGRGDCLHRLRVNPVDY